MSRSKMKPELNEIVGTLDGEQDDGGLGVE